MSDPKPIVDHKKEWTKAKHKNGKLQAEIDSLKYKLQQLQADYDREHVRLEKYETIMEFIAGELGQKFGLIPREELRDISRDW